MSSLICPRCQGINVRYSRLGRTERFGMRMVRLITMQRWYRCCDCREAFVASKHRRPRL